MKILLGEISSYKAIVVAKHLKSHYPGLEVLAYDYKQFIKRFHTRYCDMFTLVPDPMTDKNGHLIALHSLIQKNQIDIFIPVHSDMYRAYIKNKEIFGKAFSYVGDFTQFEMLHDKKKVSNFLDELNIKQPRIYDSFDNATLPFIIKPTNLSSAKGVKYVLTEDERKKYKSEYSSDLLIQEYVRGTGIGYSVFARDGEIHVGFGHIRLAEQPVTGGSSVYRDSYFDCRTRDLVQKILREVKWSGFAMFEFKLTSGGEIYVIEVNPRIWGSINQGLQNGFNYFEPILGKSSVKASPSAQHKTYLSPLIYKSFLGYLARWNVAPILQFIKNIRYNRADVSFFDDPRGYVSMIARKV